MQKKPTKQKSKIVLVRTYSAGVHVGELVSRNGQEVTLREAHRICRVGGWST